MATLEAMTPQPLASRRRLYRAGSGAAGAAAGAGLGGIFAGPPGMIAGALFGALVGVSGSWAFEMRAKEDTRPQRKLDRDIGVDGGDIGVPGLKHPPSTIGAFSREASGAGSTTEQEQAEGPIQPPPE